MSENSLLQPRLVRWSDLADPYEDAKAAIAAGAHYVALRLAREAKDSEHFAAALILCGWSERGLALLEKLEITDPVTYLHQAYGFWALGREAEALKALHNSFDPRADRLRQLIAKARIQVLMIAGTHTARGVPPDQLVPFDIRSVTVGEDETAPPLADILDSGFVPEMIVVLDVYGNRIPEGVFSAGIPVVFWGYDADYMMAAQTDDLSRADLLVGAYAEEHDTLTRIHGARVAQLLTHDVHTDADRHRAHAASDDYDILHTGRSFTPLHRGKAQYLFSLATLDDRDARIRIEDAFYSFRSYRDGLTRARHVAVHERWVGGLQTRLVDALACGAVPLLSDDSAACLILDELGARYIFAEDFPPGSIVAHDPSLAENLREVFPPSPGRELRFLKFCLFQLLFKETVRRPSRRPPHDEAHSARYRLAEGAIRRFLTRPLEETLRRDCAEILNDALATFPNSVSLRFARARYFWSIGERVRAREDFAMLATSGAQGLFDPTREEIRFAFFRSPEELMPYNDFVRGLWLDMREGRLTLPGARSVIAATARSYLALFELQDGRIEQGIVELEAALAVFPDHFAAARLQAKALAAADRSKAEIESAVERAVALYGPSLSELLPIALAVARDADHALAWVRRWCHFIVRVRWARPEDHIVPQATWAAVEPYLDQLAPGLKTAVRQWSGSS